MYGSGQPGRCQVTENSLIDQAQNHQEFESQKSSRALRFDAEKRNQDGERKQQIACSENPSRKIIIKNPADPVLDKAGVRRAAAQRIFPRRQRTDHPHNGFPRDKEYCGKMGEAEPEVAHPAPAQSRADPDQEQPKDNKQHETKMNNKNKVGKLGHGVVTG